MWPLAPSSLEAPHVRHAHGCQRRLYHHPQSADQIGEELGVTSCLKGSLDLLLGLEQVGRQGSVSLLELGSKLMKIRVGLILEDLAGFIESTP